MVKKKSLTTNVVLSKANDLEATAVKLLKNATLEGLLDDVLSSMHLLGLGYSQTYNLTNEDKLEKDPVMSKIMGITIDLYELRKSLA